MADAQADSVETVITNAVRNSRESFDGMLDQLPEELAVLRILRSAALNAAQIHGAILHPEYKPPRRGPFSGPLNLPPACDSERRLDLMIVFVDLDNALAIASSRYHKFRGQYEEDAVHDPPLDDWCGFTGNPATIAMDYARQVHVRLLEAMLPQDGDLSGEEKQDHEAVTRRAKGRDGTGLAADVLVRRISGVPLDGAFLGPRPTSEAVNTLRDRLRRLCLLADKRATGAGGGEGTAESIDVEGQGTKLAVPVKLPGRPTKKVSLAHAAGEWFDMKPRTFKKAVLAGTYAARQVAAKLWEFDVDEVERECPGADCEPGG